MEYNRPVKLRDYIFTAVKQTPPIISLPIKCYKVSKYLDKYYLEFELTKNDRELYNSITDINETSISVIFKNSNKWFNKQMPLHVIDNYHQSNIRMRKRRPILKLVTGNSLFNNFSNLTEIQNTYEGNYYILTIDYKGIIFHKQMFINEFEIIKMESQVDKYVFDNIDSDYESKEQEQIQDTDIFTLYNEDEPQDIDETQDIDEPQVDEKEQVIVEKKNNTPDIYIKENIEIIDNIINGIEDKHNQIDKSINKITKNKITKTKNRKNKSKKRIIVYGKNKRKLHQHNL